MIKEENGTNVNTEPDWSLLMFWEDITALIQKFFVFIKSLF